MKNFKKLSLSLLTSALIFGAVGTYINADEDSKSLTVSYTLAEGYEWSIPSDITLEGGNEGLTGATKFGDVTVSNIHLNPGHTLKITYAHENMPYLANALNPKGKMAPYVVGTASDLSVSANKIMADKVILNIPFDWADREEDGEEVVKSIEFYANLAKVINIAGEYSTTVKFIATVENIA